MSQPLRWGMTVPFDNAPLHAQRDQIVELADLGYTDLWSAEANGHDGFTPLALASVWAPSLRLGTAIIPAYTRGRALLAQSVPAPDATATALRTQEVCTHQEHVFPSPPPYPSHAVGAPFRPGQQVWLYRWDDQTPRFAAPVTIVQMRTLWPGEQDIGWCDAAGALSWHHARLAVAVETQKS